MLKSFPAKARNWGAARKAMNLYLRDVAYNVDLSEAFALSQIRSLLEVPLDKDVASGLLCEQEGTSLPKWPTIKRLEPPTSAKYQAVAGDVAKRRGVDRVDLDVYYWRKREQA